MSEDGANTENTEVTGSEVQEAPVSEAEASGTTLMGGAAEAPKQEENAEQEAQPQAEEKPSGAPEEYAEFTAPEGGGEFDAQTLNEFKSVAKELNLTQEQAQKLIDKVSPSWNQALIERVKSTSQAWADKCMADPEVGGSHFQATQANVARIINTFGRTSNGEIDPDIAEFINSPMGNHPGALKLIARAGAAFGEAKYPAGGAATNAAYTPSDFYKDAKR